MKIIAYVVNTVYSLFKSILETRKLTSGQQTLFLILFGAPLISFLYLFQVVIVFWIIKIYLN